MNLSEYLKENYSPTALVSYERIIGKFLSFIGEQAATATYQDILDYISYLRKQNNRTGGLHPKTIRNNLFAIKIYYRYLIKTGQRQDHPCQRLYLKDPINRAIPIEGLYTPEQLENLLNNYEYRSLKNYSPKKQYIEHRNKVIISLLIYQALTALEITQLEVENVNLEKAEIFIKSNVKNKERTLHLKANQILLLHQYIHEIRPKLKPTHQRLILNYRGEPMISSSISDAINSTTSDKLKDYLYPFKIRQSVIAHLLKQGNDLRIVQVFAGHRSSASTEAYRQTGLEELKASINQKHPLQ